MTKPINKVWWCDRGWQPMSFGFCPSKRAWKREMKRLGVKDEPYPNTAGRCTVLENKRSGEITVLVTITEKASERPAVEVIGLLVHEGTHVWQQIKRDIGEDSPSPEFEAYSMQAITQGLIQAYEETRGPLHGNR